MTGLLVSVRSAGEAAAALAGGASVIDIKEPDRGALGAADPLVWRAVLGVVAGRVPVSAALGELYDEDGDTAAVEQLAAQTSGLAFAKIGLAGAARHRHWPERWRQVLASLPASVAAVAVAYADWQSAHAPPPEEVIDYGADFGCTMLLLDTFAKSHGNLFDHMPLAALHRCSRRASHRGMVLVLAGSLTKSIIPQALALSPALIAVRGAVCRPSRSGAVDVTLVRELAATISPGTSTTPDTSTIVRGGAPWARGA